MFRNEEAILDMKIITLVRSILFISGQGGVCELRGG